MSLLAGLIIIPRAFILCHCRLHQRKQLPRGQPASCMCGERLPILHSWDGFTRRICELFQVPQRHILSGKRFLLYAVPYGNGIISRLHQQ